LRVGGRFRLNPNWCGELVVTRIERVFEGDGGSVVFACYARPVWFDRFCRWEEGGGFVVEFLKMLALVAVIWTGTALVRLAVAVIWGW
jgi:hypothetical protein